MPPQPPYYSPQGPVYGETNLKFAGNPFAWEAVLTTSSQLVVPSRPRRKLFFVNPGVSSGGGGTSAEGTLGGDAGTLGGDPGTLGASSGASSLSSGGSPGTLGGDSGTLGGVTGTLGTGGGGNAGTVYICPAVDAEGNALAATVGGAGTIPIAAGSSFEIPFSTQAFNACAATAGTNFTVWEFL